MFDVALFPAFEDNYVFLLTAREGKTAAVVDPGDALGVLGALQEKDLLLTHIFVTHHHNDHVGGVKLLKEIYPDAQVVCGAYDAERRRVPLVSRVVGEGDTVEFAGAKGRVMDIPGHTLGHVAYVFENGANTDAFVGDTLFGGGSGGLFEGTPAQMLTSLKKLRALADATRVYCAHEYTEKNLRVALDLKEDNFEQRTRFEEVAALRAAKQRTVPLSLGEEKRTNPFLRWDVPTLQAALGTRDELETFTAVRKHRDRF